jgi:hypothetical protein
VTSTFGGSLEAGCARLRPDLERAGDTGRLDQRPDCFTVALAGIWSRRSERHFFLQIGQPANAFTTPRSLERFDIPEGTLDHSVG